MKIFLDANILFSAAKADSATRKLFDLLCSSGHILFTSEYTLEEAQRNLSLKRVQSLDELASMLSEIKITKLFVELPEFNMNENDKVLMCSAVAVRCDVFWTGDKRHFGYYYGSEIHGVKVLSSVMLAELAINK